MSLVGGIEQSTLAGVSQQQLDMSTAATAVPVVNPLLAPNVFNPNVKDSRWLTLEVCREFTRNKCSRPDTECKFAHPPPHVEVQNGRVTCCFDSIKGKCQRKEPPCKYLHPPQHLREQLLQNGRNNLILKQFQAQGLAFSSPLMMPYANMTPNLLQYYQTPSPYIAPMPGMMSLDGTASGGALPQTASQLGVMQGVTSNGTAMLTQQKTQRGERLDMNGSTPVSDAASYSALHQNIDTLGTASSQYPGLYVQNINPGVPGMMVKRPAVEKGGVPVYQPAAAAYPPLMQFAQPPYMPAVTQTLQYYRGEQTSPYSPVSGPTALPRFN